jgi:hypothetical protein
MKRYHCEPEELSRKLADLLEDPPKPEEIARWARQQRHQVEQWAAAIGRKLAGEKLTVPPKPTLLDGRRSMTAYVIGRPGKAWR